MAAGTGVAVWTSDIVSIRVTVAVGPGAAVGAGNKLAMLSPWLPGRA